MNPWAVTARICDQQSCPAPAQRTLLICGQDFHFCGHHGVEIQRRLRATGAGDWIAVAVTLAEPRAALSRRPVPALPPRRTAQAR